MIGNLPHFLLRKKTLAVAGVLIVLMVGIGIWLRSNRELRLDPEAEREMITIAERLLSNHFSEFGEGDYFRFTKANITQNEADKFGLEGKAFWGSKDSPSRVEVRVVFEKREGEWALLQISYRIDSLWERILMYVETLLP